MKAGFSLVFAMLLCVPCLGETIRLRSGKILLGRIEGEPDERGFLFKRFDNGGVLEIKWEHLMPGDARRLKEKFGFLEANEEEITVKAMRFTIGLPGLSNVQTRIGILVKRTDKFIIIRVKGIETKIRKDLIKGTPEWVEVPALEVYTKDEFYHRQLQEIQPGEDPAKHEKLARILMAAGDYKMAKEHLLKVLELDPEYKNKGGVERALKQVEEAIANKDIMELMKKLRQERSRRNYKKAMEIAEELDKKYDTMPRSLKLLWVKRKQRLLKERKLWLGKTVASRVYEMVRKVAQAKALDRNAGPEEIKEFAKSEMWDLIIQKVSLGLGLEKDEAQGLWDEREALKTYRVQRASYGDGTFILPKDKALAGTAYEGELSKAGGKNKRRMSEIEKRIREFLRRKLQNRLNKKGGGAGENREKTPEEWWAEARINERKLWIMAYFAEFSGVMKVKKAFGEPCKTCGGTGYLSGIDLKTGKEIRTTCPACHGYRIRRSITYY